MPAEVPDHSVLQLVVMEGWRNSGHVQVLQGFQRLRKPQHAKPFLRANAINLNFLGCGISRVSPPNLCKMWPRHSITSPNISALELLVSFFWEVSSDSSRKPKKPCQSQPQIQARRAPFLQLGGESKHRWSCLDRLTHASLEWAFDYVTGTSFECAHAPAHLRARAHLPRAAQHLSATDVRSAERVGWLSPHYLGLHLVY